MPNRDDPYFARREHAFLLRCEGVRLKEIGTRLGVSSARARQLISEFARHLSRVLYRRHTRIRIVEKDDQ